MWKRANEFENSCVEDYAWQNPAEGKEMMRAETYGIQTIRYSPH